MNLLGAKAARVGDQIDAEVRAVDSMVQLSIKEAIHNLSKQIDDSIKQLPNEDKVRNIVREVLKEEDIATKTYVRERVTKAQLWLYVTFGTAVLSLIVTAIRLFMK